MGAAAGGGWSVAEHSPWELVGERVPALYPLVLVFQAVKPVLQALTLSVDAQDHAACKNRAKWVAGDTATPRGLQTSAPIRLSLWTQSPYPKTTLSRFCMPRLYSLPCPPDSEGGQWSDHMPHS